MLPALNREVADYFKNARADSTLRAYRADLRDFEAWCRCQERQSLPASVETLVLYLTELARTRRVTTLTRRLSALSQAHQAVGYESPGNSAAVKTLMAGIRRVKGTAPRSKKALEPQELLQAVQALPETLAGQRDKALLLLGFAGAFRRSELVSLDWADLEWKPEGIVITLRRSKTDPEGQGRKIGIPYSRQGAHCPVRALEAWRDQKSNAGSVFRAVDRAGRLGDQRLSDRSVARILKRTLESAGIESTEYAGHSLRAGFATAAAAGGASERAIMNQTGHRSLPVLRRYIREGSLFTDNAFRNTGL